MGDEQFSLLKRARYNRVCAAIASLDISMNKLREAIGNFDANISSLLDPNPVIRYRSLGESTHTAGYLIIIGERLRIYFPIPSTRTV